MSDAGPRATAPTEPAGRDGSQVLAIGEVTAQATVLKCMGRTYAAVAVNNEVRITDTTDITHPVRLGRATSRHENGTWDIVTTHNNLLTTTTDLLSAVAALRESIKPSLVTSR